MLPRLYRLRSSAAFSATIKRGSRCSTPLMTVHALRDVEMTQAQAGVIVSKAVGGAVVRNRVKRRLRAGLHQHVRALSSGRIVVRAHPAAARVPYLRLLGDLEWCLRQVDCQRK